LSDDNSNAGVYVWSLPADTALTAWVKITVYDARGNTNNAVSAAPFKIMTTPGTLIVALHTALSSDYFGISTMGKTVRCGVNAGSFHVSVYDVAGRLMMSRSSVAGQSMYQDIPMSASNACIVRLEQAGKILTKKVMPQ
jgi:hypothetical protein